MERAGAVLVEMEFSVGMQDTFEEEMTAMKHEFKHIINKYLSENIVRGTTSIKSLADLIAFNSEHADEVLSVTTDQDYFLEAEATDGIENRTYIEARRSSRFSLKTTRNKNHNSHTFLTTEPSHKHASQTH